MTHFDPQKEAENCNKLNKLADFLKIKELNPDFCYHVAKDIFRVNDQYWIVSTNDGQDPTFDRLV
jgi:hypothetical protein